MSRAESEEIMEQLHSESQLWGPEGKDGNEADGGSQSLTTCDHQLKMRWFDLIHPGLALVLWYTFLGLPASIAVAWLNRKFFRWLGYEKIMRSPNGIMGSRILFTTLNVVIIAVWAQQITEEAKEQRVRKLKEEAEWWKKACDVLEEEKKERILTKESEAHTPAPKHGTPSGMSSGRDSRRGLYEGHNGHPDYYPPTPKDMIKEVLERRARVS